MSISIQSELERVFRRPWHRTDSERKGNEPLIETQHGFSDLLQIIQVLLTLKTSETACKKIRDTQRTKKGRNEKWSTEKKPRWISWQKSKTTSYKQAREVCFYFDCAVNVRLSVRLQANDLCRDTNGCKCTAQSSWNPGGAGGAGWVTLFIFRITQGFPSWYP